MPTEDKLAKLLEKNIEASNRTTHAVRALVRFLFIQLAFLTAAAVIWQLGLAFPDEDTCSIVGCEPYGFVSAFVVLLVIAGVIISSFAGWSELELSNMTEGNVPARVLGIIDKGNLEELIKTVKKSSGFGESAPNSPKPSRNLFEDRWDKRQGSNPESSVTLPNGTKICPNCKRRFKGINYCADCDVLL
jgi:hypothetical protein